MDIFCEVDGDIRLTETGDIETADGFDEVRQCLIRLLVTSPQRRGKDGRYELADYIFAPDFGLGLGREVDEVMTDERFSNLSALIRQAIIENTSFSDEIEPSIVITEFDDNTLQIAASFRTKNGDDQNISFALVPA